MKIDVVVSADDLKTLKFSMYWGNAILWRTERWKVYCSENASRLLAVEFRRQCC